MTAPIQTGTNKCDGFARIAQQGGQDFRFDTLKGPQLKVKIEPKALHDEMNSAAFDEFGRMTANLGLEAVPATPAGQNILLYPYIAPPTEVIDGTNLPQGDINVQAISSGADGTQIWKITHNGVDTHPIHFHLFNVQLAQPGDLGQHHHPAGGVASSAGRRPSGPVRSKTRSSPFDRSSRRCRSRSRTASGLLSPMMPLGANLDPQRAHR